MAVTSVQTNNRGTKFRNKLIIEYVRGNMFSPYMSDDGMNVITSFHEEGKYGGDQINVPLITALRGSGKGSGTLTGNEDTIGNYGWRIWLDWARNAVVATKAEIKKASFDLFGQAAPRLSEWGRSKQRDEMVLAFMAIPTQAEPAGLGSDDGQRVNGVIFSTATASQRNTWNAANSDRVLYGSARSNFNSTFLTALQTVDNTADKASSAILRLAQTMAEKSDPKITPITTDDGYERYVWFVGSNAFRDLENDANIIAANKDARPREGTSYKKNPLFMPGDLLYHGVIIRKVPEIDRLLTFSNGTINCAPTFFCGRNALGLLWGQLPEATKLDDTDYQFKKGAGVEMAYGMGKLVYKDASANLKDWGVVTAWVASVDDA
ncbi:DUF4043 family protein [Bradyrhizobium sp. vgs-9]|uniref:phage capsid family protein n=1 Tax=Bradyrhizobium sp. vgs-9 TaxID=208389 RepID=UPI0035D3EFAD